MKTADQITPQAGSTGPGPMYETHTMGFFDDISTRSGTAKIGLRLLWAAVWGHKFHLNVTGFVRGRMKKIIRTPVAPETQNGKNDGKSF